MAFLQLYMFLKNNMVLRRFPLEQQPTPTSASDLILDMRYHTAESPVVIGRANRKSSNAVSAGEPHNNLQDQWPPGWPPVWPPLGWPPLAMTKVSNAQGGKKTQLRRRYTHVGHRPVDATARKGTLDCSCPRRCNCCRNRHRDSREAGWGRLSAGTQLAAAVLHRRHLLQAGRHHVLLEGRSELGPQHFVAVHPLGLYVQPLQPSSVPSTPCGFP